MLFTILVFVAILSVLVLIHELGHFFAAKLFGIKVEEFGFGLPPRIFGIKRGETIYSINWLPIGGFVKLFGEEGEESKSKSSKSKDADRAFYTRPVWQRAVVLVAGVTMNFILALVLTTYLFTRGVMVPTDVVHVEKVTASSPASKAGLQKGDIIESIQYPSSDVKTINGEEIEYKTVSVTSGDTLINTTKEHLGQTLLLTIERNGKEKEVSIVPRKNYPKDQGPMGVVVSNYEEKKYSLLEAPIVGMKESLKLSWLLVVGIGQTLFKLITFQSVSQDVAGPIGIAQMTGEAVKFGIIAVLELAALLSLNLAIVNILPFPALDGGRLVFVIIEGLTGRKIKTHWERYVHQVGMIILITLIVLVTLNDILRIFSK